MNIKLITGATAYEATVNTIKQIDCLDLEYENIVVVPDSFSMQAESLIFDVLNISSTFNIEVVGISRLASKILRKNGIEFERVSGLEEIFFVFKAVKKCEEEFVYFKKCGLDFCVKILQIIKQFKACKIKPNQIKEIGDQLLDNKMKDLKLIYQTYEELLDKKFDLSKLLEFFVNNAEKQINLTKIKLYFVNFDSFSMDINAFICKLAGLVDMVCIGYSKPISVGNAFIYEDDILRKTTEYAKEYNVVVEVENYPTNLKDEHLKIAKNLFSFCVEEGKSDKFLNVLAKNQLDEVEFVAKYIKHGIVNGKKFKDYAVAISDAGYYELIKQVFNQYGIAFYCDEAETLGNTLLGKFVLKCISITKLGFQKEDLKYIVSSSLYKNQNKEKILEDIDYFNIDNETEFVERFPEYFVIVSEIKNLNKCKKIEEFIDKIENILNLIKNDYTEILKNLNNENYFKEESINSQAWELLLKVFANLKILGQNEDIDMLDFENLIKLTFGSVKVETIPSYIDAVYVADATESYFEDVDILFVLGATANGLPKTQNDVGIIDDDDIKKLRFDFALEPEIKTLNRRRRLKLFEMLQHFNEKLIVCTPMTDGCKLQKSGFVNDLSIMFGKNIIHTSSLEDFKLPIYSEDEKIDKLLFYIGDKVNLPTVYTHLKATNKLPINFDYALKGLIDKEILNKKDRLFCLNESLQKLFFAKKLISPSQLETYFSCPFRHLLSYGLKISTKESIEPTKKMFGIFEHSLLKKFVEENKNRLSEVSNEEILKFLDENIENLAKKVYDEKILKRAYFVNYLKNESKTILRNVVKEQKYSDFTPFLLEEKVFQPFVDNINIVGYIDRVDKSEEYFRIIDYKTGHTDAIKKELFYGKKLQLFLYSSCIKKKIGLDCAGVYYFDCKTKYSKANKTTNLFNGITLKDNKVVEKTDNRLWQEEFRSDLIGVSRKKNVKDGEYAYKNGSTIENINSMMDYAVEISKVAIEELKDGNISPKPIKDECKICPYISVCCYSEKHNGTRQMQTIKDEAFKRGKNED